ncbi:glycosyltransferase family A protein [Flavobacterium pectinovorum]|uniref:Glycosyltransferase family 2 protein n=1 Tax=Flavobacterium pectinovorum TaxID=29533 RepID=A0A502ERJ6_9FLAO|nr:glycosyltransferase family A protein [Flavobacterium pectinovorum]TPG40117.1 glycosyltransferase family 2 protein [Flavobacterium pectinovorum]
MRVGFNPHKDKVQETSDYFHQIIIPVYIPNQDDYFKDGFEILKLCLNSLFATIHDKTFITIVNNGSCDLIKNYLNDLYAENKIQEIIHTVNIGKLNAILKGISGNKFSLITISDSDVLFLDNWQKATYDVFENFPKTGAVCPTPSSRSLRSNTANIYWDLFFSKKLKFTTVENPEALKKFAHSAGNIDFYNSVQLKKYLTITHKDKKAVVGAGHFVTTYRASVFDNLQKRYTNYKLGGNSESEFLDIPVVKNGFWRLSTSNNYAYHMGNVIEDWMFDLVFKTHDNHKEYTNDLKVIKSGSSFSYFIKSRLFAKFILNKKIMKYFIIRKGLSREEADTYL